MRKKKRQICISKNSKKRGITVVSGMILMFLVFFAMPAEASTISADFTYTVSKENATITSYTGEDLEVAIPSILDGYTVTAIGESAFANSSITGVTIPDTVIAISETAFANCTSLTSVKLTDNITKIYAGAFSGCTALGEIELPANLATLEKGAFSGTALESIVIPKSLTSCTAYRNVNDFNGPFSGADKLKNVEFEDGTTAIPLYILAGNDAVETVSTPDTVTLINAYAFQNCTALKTVRLSANVETIGHNAFEDSGIIKIEFPETIVSINSEAFWGCDRLESVIFTADAHSEVSVTIEDEAFVGCSSLTSVNLADNITEIQQYAFSGCTALSEIELPSNLAKLEYWVFRGTALESVEIPKNLKSCSGTTYENRYIGPFAGADKLKEVTFEDGMTAIPNYILAGNEVVDTINMPDTVTSIGACAFSHCTVLKNIELSPNVEIIGGHAFEGSGLTKIEFPETIVSINSYAFQDCSNLESVRFTTDVDSEVSVTISRNAFYNCSLLSKVIFSKNISKISEEAFSECSSLKEITLPEKLTFMGNEAFYNTGIEQIIIPKTLTSSGYYSSTYNNGPFTNAAKLNKVIFEPGMTAIPSYILSTSSESVTLTQVLIPESVTSIGENAFKNQTAITIYGLEGSYAETYARENNIPFDTWDGVIYERSIAAGELTGVDAANFKVMIEETEYDVMDSFDMSVAQSILVDQEDRRVICVLLNGKVHQMNIVSEVLVPSVKVKAEETKLVYQNGTFSKNYIDITVTLGCVVKEGSAYTLKDFKNLSGWGRYYDEFTIDMGEGKFYVKTPLTLSQYTQSVDETIAPGEYKDFTFVINHYDEYIPAAINTTYVLSVLYDENAIVNCPIQITNLDLQAANAAETKASRETEKAAREANAMLKSMTNVLALDTMLYEYCSDAQVEQIKEYLHTWLAEVAMSSSIKYSVLDEGVRYVLNKKLGISTSSTILTKRTTAVTKVIVQNSKYGTRTFEFQLVMDGYILGDGDPFACLGTLTYEVTNTDGLPDGITKSGDGAVTFANLKAFAEKVSEVAVDAVNDVYGEAWGTHVDELANLIVDVAILKIINSEFGVVSNGVFTLMEAGTRELISKTAAVLCPVDVYVYDLSGNLCGSIVDNVVNSENTTVGMYVDGDKKYIDFIGDDYIIKLIGNDTGIMTYRIVEYSDGMKEIRTVEFSNLPLADGTTYEGLVLEPIFMDSSLYALTSDSDEKILPDTDTYEEPEPPELSEDEIETPVCTHSNFRYTTTASTCVKSGKKVTACASCGAIVKTETLPILKSHSYGAWSVKSEATVLVPQIQIRKCVVTGCTSSETRKVGSKLNPILKLPGDVGSFSIKKGKSYIVKIAMAEGDSLVSCKSSKNKSLKVSSVKAAGTFKVSAKRTGKNIKLTIKLASGATKTVKVTVTTKTVKTSLIMGVPGQLTLEKNKKYTLKPELKPFTSTQKLKYKSSNKKVATVSAKGKITAKSPGKTVITIVSGSKTKKVKVTVKGIGNIKSSYKVKRNKSMTLKLKCYGVSGKVMFTSSKPNIVQVNSKGKVTGKKKGTAYITMSAGNYKVRCKIKVE